MTNTNLNKERKCAIFNSLCRSVVDALCTRFLIMLRQKQKQKHVDFLIEKLERL